MDYPLAINEGNAIDHAGNVIATMYADFRSVSERLPIGAVVKHCESRFAIERSGAVKLTKPIWYQRDGETLIFDRNEGLVEERERRLLIPNPGDFLLTVQGRWAEVTGKRGTIRWGNDTWLFCTAIEPTTKAEYSALKRSLDPRYDHETLIPSPRTFAQMLGRAYIETYGSPEGELAPATHNVDNVSLGVTHHPQLMLLHGPVLYLDDPYAACVAATEAGFPLAKVFQMFVKHKRYSDQREYRFVVSDKNQMGITSKVMEATPLLLAALNSHYQEPMHVPTFHPDGD